MAAPRLAQFDADPRWDLVVRLVESRRFAKSARLREFLVYISHAALAGEWSEITEHKIGQRVFGRTPDYNPHEDNIVRSHARLLRQKLEAYFVSEGASEPLVLRIPKGGYVPEFLERPPQEPEAPPHGFSQSVAVWLAAAAAVLSFCVAILVILVARGESGPRGAGSPALDALWSQMFSDKMTTTIVIPDHTFAMLQEASGRRRDLQAYLHGAPPGDQTGENPAGGLRTLFPEFSERRYTTFDGFSTALRVVEISHHFPGRVTIRYARDLTPAEIGRGHTILIGRPTANLWTQLFDSRLNFHLDSDLQNRRVIGRNSAPQPGEPAEFVPRMEPRRSESYSAVAFLDNFNGGNVLLIGGAASSAEQSAANFVTSARLLGELSQKISRSGRMPHFDALLRTVTVDGVSQEPSIAAYRVLASR